MANKFKRAKNHGNKAMPNTDFRVHFSRLEKTYEAEQTCEQAEQDPKARNQAKN